MIRKEDAHRRGEARRNSSSCGDGDQLMALAFVLLVYKDVIVLELRSVVPVVPETNDREDSSILVQI